MSEIKNRRKRLGILFTPAEKQSGLDRQRAAEGLIEQLPENHDGRNTWLLNYGVKDVAVQLRQKHKLTFSEKYRAAETQG